MIPWTPARDCSFERFRPRATRNGRLYRTREGVRTRCLLGFYPRPRVICAAGVSVMSVVSTLVRYRQLAEHVRYLVSK
jgi:hypothetical protein